MPNHYDISPQITADIAVFPGDTPYRHTVLADFAQGNNLRLSKIETTVHLGAHADAPNHYDAHGVGIGARSLHYYYGDCQVVRVRVSARERIQPAHLDGVKVQAPRVLFWTGSYGDANAWTDDFAALSPQLIDMLASQGVQLVGIDTPSVDLSDDKVLQSHQAIARHDIAILEGLMLDLVPAGLYHLTALPLPLQHADASPVRAVLWDKM